MLLTTNSVHIQGTSLALSNVERAPHKPFGLEPLGIESLDLELETETLEAEMLRAERFTPPDIIGISDMPVIDSVLGGVHKALQSDWANSFFRCSALIARFHSLTTDQPRF